MDTGYVRRKDDVARNNFCTSDPMRDSSVWKAAAIILCCFCSNGSAQTVSSALSVQEKWVADLTDEAANRAERLWYKCISDVPNRRRDASWVDEVVGKCADWLTFTLDVKTAAIWIRFNSRVPDLRIADERLKQHQLLIDQIRNLPRGTP